MSVLINFKICDNAKECRGVEVCPTKALHWDEKNQTIIFDEKKCSLCGLCEKACEISAIKVAKNKAEYKKYKKEIDDDPRKINDLFVERYGATSIIPAFQVKLENFDREILESNKLTVVEVYNDDSIECLLNSIPIKMLFEDKVIKYRRFKVEDDNFLNKYKIKKIPALLFLKKGN